MASSMVMGDVGSSSSTEGVGRGVGEDFEMGGGLKEFEGTVTSSAEDWRLFQRCRAGPRLRRGENPASAGHLRPQGG